MRLPFIFASRFVAAETLEQTVPTVLDLNRRGLTVALDMLGEYVRDKTVALQATEAYIGILRTIDEQRQADGMQAHPSIKLSMLGQKIDASFCTENLHRLLEEARRCDLFVCCDMEGSDLTQSTLDIFESVHADFPDHVGIVLQAYLHRTAEDVDRMCSINARVRICKGAYKEPAGIAYQDMPTIREKYLEHAIRLMRSARFPGIATHDDLLIDAVKAFARDEGLAPDRYEFQMLYGIRPETQLQIVREGYNMRVYVPYGTEWLPYYLRRLRERKENVWFVVRNLFRR